MENSWNNSEGSTRDLRTDLHVENLTDLTGPQLAAVGALQVSERQAFQGKSVQESLEDWRQGPPDQILGLCFLQADQPVGMTVFQRPPTSKRGDSTVASIHGLKIATPWQGRGWGHAAFRLAVRRLKQEWPATTILTLAVDADNHAAIAVYRAFGMTDSGPVFEGNHGPEHRMEVSLHP